MSSIFLTFRNHQTAATPVQHPKTPHTPSPEQSSPPHSPTRPLLDVPLPLNDAATRARSLPEVLGKVEGWRVDVKYFEEYTPQVRWFYAPVKVGKEEAHWRAYSAEESELFEVMMRVHDGGVVLRKEEGRRVDLKKRLDYNKKVGSKEYKMIRGTWFYESQKGGFVPYSEKVSFKLEKEFYGGAMKVKVSSNPVRYVEIFNQKFRQYRNSTNADLSGRRVNRGYEDRLVELKNPFKEIKLLPLPLLEFTPKKQQKEIHSTPTDRRTRIERLKTIQSNSPAPKTIGELEKEKDHREIIRKLNEDCAKYRDKIKELEKKLLSYESKHEEQKQDLETLHHKLKQEGDLVTLQEIDLRDKEDIIEKLMERLKGITGQEEVVMPGEVNYSEQYEEVRMLKVLADQVKDANEEYKAHFISDIAKTYQDVSLDEIKVMFADIL